VSGTLSTRQAFVGCLKILHCTSDVESGLSCTSHVSNGLGCVLCDGGDSLDRVLCVGDGLEFAFLVQLSLMMPLLVLKHGVDLSCGQPCVGPKLALAFCHTLGVRNGLVELDCEHGSGLSSVTAYCSCRG